jgi:hypothetical protein
MAMTVKHQVGVLRFLKIPRARGEAVDALQSRSPD